MTSGSTNGESIKNSANSRNRFLSDKPQRHSYQPNNGNSSNTYKYNNTKQFCQSSKNLGANDETQTSNVNQAI